MKSDHREASRQCEGQAFKARYSFVMISVCQPNLESATLAARQVVLSIGELSHRTSASVRAIPHYDEHALLKSQRADNGYRTFAEIAVTQVKQIQRMIATDFSLAEIRAFPECMLLIEDAATCSETTDAQRKRLADIDRQIAELERCRARLRKTLAEGAIPPLE